MSTPLRPFQATLKAGIYAAWSVAQNVLAVAPTGSGKTVLFSNILQEQQGATCAIAHRQELVSQISLALARNGVRHSLGCSDATRRDIIASHLDELGKHYYDPNARCRVVGVDTLVRMDAGRDPWFRQVQLWVLDEAHHLLKDNKWGSAVAMFPNARGLGVTATPCRADGKGLGRHAAGLFDTMTVGPSMRDLMTQGYLTDYRIYCPPSDIRLSEVPVGSSGDYSSKPLRAAVHKSSRIIGDVVSHYQKFAAGKLGVTFAVDVEAAGKLAMAYRAAGIPAEVVSAETPSLLRSQILRRFRQRELLQLVNVDLFGEGFDLPAIECVSMARPTKSYPLYVQQFGRALRPLDGKERAIIIDHVGNVREHKVPDRIREWTLDNVTKVARKANDEIPLRTCLECLQPFERIHRICPYCGHYPEPAGRTAPEEVDGDLQELTPSALAALRGEIDRIGRPAEYPRGAGPEVVGAIRKRHHERQVAQGELREAMAMWAGRWGGTDSELQRRFFHTYGMDVLTAQTLGAREAEELKGRL